MLAALGPGEPSRFLVTTPDGYRLVDCTTDRIEVKREGKVPTKLQELRMAEVRKAGGVYYTPTYIVDYIVRQTVGEHGEGAPVGRLALCRVRQGTIRAGQQVAGFLEHLGRDRAFLEVELGHDPPHRLDRRLADLGDERGVGARRVLAGELGLASTTAAVLFYEALRQRSGN